MKQKRGTIASLLLCACIVMGAFFTQQVFAVEPSVSWDRTQLFDDVHENDWFYDSVYSCCQSGIFMGDDVNKFYPSKKITAQESYAVLARLYQRYVGDTTPLVAGSGEDILYYDLWGNIDDLWWVQPECSDWLSRGV